MKERTIYQCEHCHKKRLFSKGAMENHEEKCWWNLENKSCVTCWYNHGWFEKNPEDGEYRSCEKGTHFENAKPKVNCGLWKSFEEAVEELEVF